MLQTIRQAMRTCLGQRLTKRPFREEVEAQSPGGDDTDWYCLDEEAAQGYCVSDRDSVPSA